MKVLQFTVPIVNEYSITVEEDILPYFYSHLHSHKETQITLIIKGEGTLITGNYTQTFKAGEVYFVSKDQPHLFTTKANVFEARNQNNVHAIHIFFDHKNNLAGLLDLPEMESIKKFINGFDCGLQVSPDHVPHVSKLIKEIRDSEGLSRLMLLVKLLQYCVNDAKQWKLLSTGLIDHSFIDSEGMRMNDVYHYTVDHYSECISLNEISSIACMTPHAFCKYFKRHTRKTYLAYLHEIRINEACKKIVSEGYNGISSVAYSTGFNSVITFNRVFKKITSMSPKDYLKKCKFKNLNPVLKDSFCCFFYFFGDILIS